MITTRKRSLRKIMVSQVCVSAQVGYTGHCIGHMVGYPFPRTRDLDPRSLLTPCGHQQDTYSWQAGCMQPTGILSCYVPPGQGNVFTPVCHSVHKKGIHHKSHDQHPGESASGWGLHPGWGCA